MRIVTRYEDLPSTCRGGVVALGNFDGVHLGHQAVIGQARAIAADLGAPLAVMTFEPHPRQFFNPEGDPFRLTSFEGKARLMQDLGVEILYALPFDRALSAKPAAEFVMDVLVTGVAALSVVVGHDFRFGQARAGDASVLAYMGEMEGFGLEVVDPVAAQDEAGPEDLSSSRIRHCLRDGAPAHAAALLGHWWFIDGKVATGHQRGRTIGFPTANIALEQFLRPAYGVYAVLVERHEGSVRTTHGGVANLGVRPTVDGGNAPVLEVHLFDFDDDLYGDHLTVHFVDFLRAEKRFDGLEALKAQIGKDVAAARTALKGKTVRAGFERLTTGSA